MRFLAVGECMLELSGAGAPDLWRSGVAGDTLNTAWYARALLPADWQVGYFTLLGRDPLSDRMQDFIAAAGIATDTIARHPSRGPGAYMIELQGGERSFIYWRDSSAARCLADDPARLTAGFAAADVVYFSGITLAIVGEAGRERLLAALAQAAAAGKRVVFDTNLRPRLWPDATTMCRATEAAAALAAIVLPSHDDEVAQFGDADPAETAARYLGLGAAEVLVKNGGGPMVLGLRDGGIRQLPELARVAPVDTTGAGDSFNGGYLAARLQGAAPEAAAAAGHAVAMQVVRHRGALMPMAELARAGDSGLRSS